MNSSPPSQTTANNVSFSEDRNNSAPGVRSVTDHTSMSTSVPITPATDAFMSSGPNARPASATLRDPIPAEEVLRLKLELAHYKSQVALLEREKHTSDPNSPPAVLSPAGITMDPAAPRPGSSFQHNTSGNTLAPGTNMYPVSDPSWVGQDDMRPDSGDNMSAQGFNRTRSIWGSKNTFQPSYAPASISGPDQWMSRSFNQSSYVEGTGPYGAGRVTPDPDIMVRSINNGRRGNRYNNSYGHQNSFSNGYTGYRASGGQYDPMGMPGAPHSGPVSLYPSYQPQPVGTLSPHAPEFTAASRSSWKNEVCLIFWAF